MERDLCDAESTVAQLKEWVAEQRQQLQAAKVRILKKFYLSLKTCFIYSFFYFFKLIKVLQNQMDF